MRFVMDAVFVDRSWQVVAVRSRMAPWRLSPIVWRATGVLELPEGMVYVSDVPGMRVIDEKGEEIGKVVEVLEQGPNDLLVVETPGKEILIPWNDHFVTLIDKDKGKVLVDLSALRDIL